MAARALLAGSAYDALSVNAIAGKAGISKATFYAYFESKEALRQALLGEGMDRALLSRRDNRAAIIEAALQTFAERGFQATSLDDVADAAGITKGTIYWYFKQKKDLLAAAAAQLSPLLGRFPDLLGHIDNPPETVLPLIARTFVATFENPAAEKLFRIFIAEAPREPDTASGIGDAVLAALRFFTAYLLRQIELGRLRPHNVQASARSFMGGLIVYVMGRSLFSPLRTGLPEPDVYVSEVVRIFLEGLATPCRAASVEQEYKQQIPAKESTT